MVLKTQTENIVRRISVILRTNRALYDKNIKLGTQIL